MANTYLTRTPSSTGNRRKFTFSAWVKFNFNQLANNSRIFSCGSATTSWVGAYFNSDGTLQLAIVEGGSTYDILTNAIYKDENAWYHVVFVVDTGNATADNRLRMYVNGQEQTSFSNRNNPTQDLDTQANTASKPIDIGSAENVGYSPRYFPGIMSHVHMSDGYVYDASTFGLTDATTGEWTINTAPSITMGTNGFTILKDGMTITDQSTNSNNFSVGGGTLTKTEDNPSNVFATMNPLDNYYQSSTFTEGNNTVEHGQSAWTYNTSTLKIPEATKFYCEGKVIAMNQNTCGIATNVTTGDGGSNTALGNITGGVGFRGNQGDVLKAGSTQSGTWATFTTNDIIQIACDTVNNKLYFGKNGTWLNSGDPTSGASGTGAVSINDNTDYFFAFGDNTSGGRGKWSINFGNGYFGTTAVSSAGTNASNLGIFEYDVPTGYTALCTKGLNE